MTQTGLNMSGTGDWVFLWTQVNVSVIVKNLFVWRVFWGFFLGGSAVCSYETVWSVQMWCMFLCEWVCVYVCVCRCISEHYLCLIYISMGTSPFTLEILFFSASSTDVLLYDVLISMTSCCPCLHSYVIHMHNLSLCRYLLVTLVIRSDGHANTIPPGTVAGGKKIEGIEGQHAYIIIYVYMHINNAFILYTIWLCMVLWRYCWYWIMLYELDYEIYYHYYYYYYYINESQRAATYRSGCNTGGSWKVMCVASVMVLWVVGWDGMVQPNSCLAQGSHLREKNAFLHKKRAGYTNQKMPCVYCTQKTVTSHIKMRLVFSFFAPSREGL